MGIKIASSPLRVRDSGVILSESSSNLGYCPAPSDVNLDAINNGLAFALPCSSGAVSKNEDGVVSSSLSIAPYNETNISPDDATTYDYFYPSNAISMLPCYDSVKLSSPSG